MRDPKTMLSLHLVSWNLHGPPLAPRRDKRFAAAAERILALAPEVVCLQEVWFQGEATQLVGALASAYDVVEPPQGWFPGQRGGLLTFVARRSGWQVRQRQFSAFADAAPVWRFWEGDGYAGKGLFRTDLQRDGQTLIVINTHMQAQYGSRSYRRVRRNQIAQLNRTVAAIPADEPVLACGDFNTDPNDSIYRTMDEAWIDLTKGFRESCGCSTQVKESIEGRWIDYALLRRHSAWRNRLMHVTRLESHTPDEPYSDHHGLDLRLEIDRQHAGLDSLSALAWNNLGHASTRRTFLASAAIALATTSSSDFVARLTADQEAAGST